MKHLLIVAYYFKPYKGVGALRPTYWAENIQRISNGEWCVQVVTAQQQLGSPSPEIHYLAENKMLPELEDKGFNWLFPLARYLLNNKSKYHVILFTGGPFFHFLLSAFLKLSSRPPAVILDYRDPFANNPNHIVKPLFKYVKSVTERLSNFFSDRVITVNQYCRALLRAPDRKVVLIDNGYDERYFNSPPCPDIAVSEPYTAIYPGKLYLHTFDSSIFFSVITSQELSDRLRFNYFGPDQDVVPESINISRNAPISYERIVRELCKADFGVIFTSGRPFESTTKVYDYIGAGLPILIISQGEEKTGALNAITKDYPYVAWAQNNFSSIEAGIKAIFRLIRTSEHATFNRASYSRESGTRQLIGILNELTEERE